MLHGVNVRVPLILFGIALVASCVVAVGNVDDPCPCDPDLGTTCALIGGQRVCKRTCSPEGACPSGSGCAEGFAPEPVCLVGHDPGAVAPAVTYLEPEPSAGDGDGDDVGDGDGDVIGDGDGDACDSDDQVEGCALCDPFAADCPINCPALPASPVITLPIETTDGCGRVAAEAPRFFDNLRPAITGLLTCETTPVVRLPEGIGHLDNGVARKFVSDAVAGAPDTCRAFSELPLDNDEVLATSSCPNGSVARLFPATPEGTMVYRCQGEGFEEVHIGDLRVVLDPGVSVLRAGHDNAVLGVDVFEPRFHVVRGDLRVLIEEPALEMEERVFYARVGPNGWWVAILDQFLVEGLPAGQLVHISVDGELEILGELIAPVGGFFINDATPTGAQFVWAIAETFGEETTMVVLSVDGGSTVLGQFSDHLSWLPIDGVAYAAQFVQE